MIQLSYSPEFGWVEGTRTLNDRSHSAVLYPLELRPTSKGQQGIDRDVPLDVVTISIRPELAGMTRLELANQLIEGQPAFHFAFIPMVHMRVERVELVTVLILSQLPLPFGLHAQKLVPVEGFEPTLSSF